MAKVLITGISGSLGRLLTKHLLGRGHAVCGIDRKPWKNRPAAVNVYEADVRKKKTEDVIRKERPDSIVHLAFIRHFAANPALRHETNVNGTRHLIEFAVGHGVESIVVFSSSYVYGALPENPFYMDETFPLSVSRTYPDIRDLAELDMLTTAYIWQHPETAIAVLRPVSILGKQVRSALGRYLVHDYVPTVLGFNPMAQFIHEDDMATALVLAVEQHLRGVFNVVGPGAVPLDVAIREVGGTPVPLPEALIRLVVTRLFRWGLYPFPIGAIDFTKYQCTLNGERFSAATGFQPANSLEAIFASVRKK